MPPKHEYKTVTELLGQPAPPATGRERLVAAAIELFYRQGFQAVGIDSVLHHAGVSKSTFYKHFEGKDDLMLAAVQTRDEWEMQAWIGAVQKLADDPRGQLLAVFDVLDVWFNDPEFGGCIFINTASEFPNPNDPVHQAAAEHKVKNRDLFRDLAQAAGASDPDAFADQYTALVEGTLVLRQVHHRNDAASVIRPAVEALMNDSFSAA